MLPVSNEKMRIPHNFLYLQPISYQAIETITVLVPSFTRRISKYFGASVRYLVPYEYSSQQAAIRMISETQKKHEVEDKLVVVNLQNELSMSPPAMRVVAC